MCNSAMFPVREVSIVADTYPHTAPLKEALITSPLVNLNFTEFKPVSTAFDVEVRELSFDVCEMAIATFFQALDNGKPLRLMPVVMFGEFHHSSLWFDPANGSITPDALKGRRIGVRAYSQTTGLWVRGILQEEYGISSGDITWVTTEAPHVAEYTNPPNVQLEEGANLTDMVHSGAVDAVIIGSRRVRNSELQHVIPNIDAAVAEWYAKYQFVPINHMVVVTDDLLQKDYAAVQDIYDMFNKGYEMSQLTKSNESLSAVRFGTENVWGALQLAMQYALEQKLISRVFDKKEVFGDMIDFN